MFRRFLDCMKKEIPVENKTKCTSICLPMKLAGATVVIVFAVKEGEHLAIQHDDKRVPRESDGTKNIVYRSSLARIVSFFPMGPIYSSIIPFTTYENRMFNFDRHLERIDNIIESGAEKGIHGDEFHMNWLILLDEIEELLTYSNFTDDSRRVFERILCAAKKQMVEESTTQITIRNRENEPPKVNLEEYKIYTKFRQAMRTTIDHEQWYYNPHAYSWVMEQSNYPSSPNVGLIAGAFLNGSVYFDVTKHLYKHHLVKIRGLFAFGNLLLTPGYLCYNWNLGNHQKPKKSSCKELCPTQEINE